MSDLFILIFAGLGAIAFAALLWVIYDTIRLAMKALKDSENS